VQENITNFRKRVLKTAQIVLSDKVPKLECSIRNLTEAGACLQLSTTYGLPVKFDVVIEGVRRPAGRSGERTKNRNYVRIEKKKTPVPRQSAGLCPLCGILVDSGLGIPW